MPTKQGARLRKLADAMTKEVQRMTAPPDWTRTNWTRKRGAEADQRLREGAHLADVQRALYALANQWDGYTIAHELAYLLSKAQVDTVLRYDTPHRWAMEGANIKSEREYMATRAALLPLATGDRSFLEAAAREQEVRRMIGQVPGFYPTPVAVIDRMFSLVRLRSWSLILEPSAGDGAILRQLPRLAQDHGADNLTVHAIEYNGTLRDHLQKQGFNVIGEDFLVEAPKLLVKGIRYDLILMNPPFENGQPLSHIRAAYDLLSDSGELVAVVPSSVFTNSANKFREFQFWITSAAVGDFEEYDLPPDSFRESGTGVQAKLLHLVK